MALPKPNPGEKLRASDIRAIAIHAEANTPRPGTGITIRRTPGGSIISLDPSTFAAAASSSPGSFTNTDPAAPSIDPDPSIPLEGSGLPDGTVIWGRIEYDETYHRFLQYKEKWNAEEQAFVEFEQEGVSPKEITTFVSHDHVHGAEDES